MSKKTIFGLIALFFLLSNKSNANASGGNTNLIGSGGNGFVPVDGAEGTADESYLGVASYPRGVRNNNPGNIKYYSSNAWQGKIPAAQNTEERRLDGTPLFEQYVSWMYGVRAMIYLLKISYLPGPRNTIKKVLEEWAPDYSSGYLSFLVNKVGKGENEVISPNDEQTIKKLVQAIARFENDRKTTVQEVITDAQYNLARQNL